MTDLNNNAQCWFGGPQHDWVDEFELEGETFWTCDRCGEMTRDD